MVYINKQCVNIEVPKGVLGGAICECEKCTKKREEEMRERENNNE